MSSPRLAPAAATPPADGLPVPRRYWAIAAIILAITMSVLDSTIVNVALPSMAHDFSTSDAASIWVINSYQVAILIALLPLASLGEIVGYRRISQWGLGIFTVASLACALAPTLGILSIAQDRTGPRRCRNHECELRVGALHLSAADVRTRDRHQRIRGSRRGRDRPNHRLGDPGYRSLALAVCCQRADRCHHYCHCHVLTAGERALLAAPELRGSCAAGRDLRAAHRRAPVAGAGTGHSAGVGWRSPPAASSAPSSCGTRSTAMRR